MLNCCCRCEGRFSIIVVIFPMAVLFHVKAACDVFCVGDDVNIEKANDSLISNDRSWKKSKFRLTYTAEAPALTEGKR